MGVFDRFAPSVQIFCNLLGGVPRIFQSGLKGSILWLPNDMYNRAYRFTPRPYIMNPWRNWVAYRRKRLANNVLSTSLANVLAYGSGLMHWCQDFLDSVTSGVASIVGFFVRILQMLTSPFTAFL